MFAFTDEDNPTIIDLYTRKWKQYYKKALYITRNPGSAEEIVQQAFADFIDAYDDRRSMGLDEMERYLMQMVINQSQRRMRKLVEVPTDPEEISNLMIESDSESIGQVEHWMVIREACKRLSPRCYQYLLLASYGFDNTAISNIMGITLQSAYVLHTRTIQQLRKQIEWMEGGEQDATKQLG